MHMKKAIIGIAFLISMVWVQASPPVTAFICEDGQDIELNGRKIPETTDTPTTIRLENIKNMPNQ
jgi:hypothetical protein